MPPLLLLYVCDLCWECFAAHMHSHIQRERALLHYLCILRTIARLPKRFSSTPIVVQLPLHLYIPNSKIKKSQNKSKNTRSHFLSLLEHAFLNIYLKRKGRDSPAQFEVILF